MFWLVKPLSAAHEGRGRERNMNDEQHIDSLPDRAYVCLSFSSDAPTKVGKEDNHMLS